MILQEYEQQGGCAGCAFYGAINIEGIHGIILTVALIGTTEFVIGLLLLREYDKLQKDNKHEE